MRESQVRVVTIRVARSLGLALRILLLSGVCFFVALAVEEGGDRLAQSRIGLPAGPVDLATNVVGVLIAGIAVLAALAAMAVVWSGLSERRFLALHDGELFFVAQPKRGWRECLENNLLPVLRSEVGVLWPGEPFYERFYRLLRSNGLVVPRPFTLRIEGSTLVVQPLNRALQELRQRGAADPSAQAQAALKLRSLAPDLVRPDAAV